MKYQYVALAAVVVVATFSLAALAEKQAPAAQVFLLKAGGKTIAELRVQPSATISVKPAGSSGHVEYCAGTGAFLATGGAILELIAGTNSISVRADEIDSQPNSQ